MAFYGRHQYSYLKPADRPRDTVDFRTWHTHTHTPVYHEIDKCVKIE